jgi:hypothetical protein
MQDVIVPPEMLQEIVSSLQPLQNDDRDARRQPRVRVRTHVAILVRSGQSDVQTVQVQVRDISAGGIGILRSQPMRLDEPFIALLPRNNQPDAAVLGQVAFWEPLAERLVAVGCRFHRILTAEEVTDAKRTLARAAARSESLDLFEDMPRREIA